MVTILNFLYSGVLHLALLLSFVLIVHCKWVYGYWKSRRVPHLPARLLFGNLDYDSSFVHTALTFKKMYDQFKAQGVKRGGGIYLVTSIKYLVTDTELAKLVLQRDYQNFTDRKMYYNEKSDPISANLAVFGGERWHVLRTKLSSAFSPSKVKLMFGSIVGCGEKMMQILDKICAENKAVDIRKISNRFATDAIALYAFGLEANSFEAGAEFIKHGEHIFESLSLWRRVQIAVAICYPKIAKMLGLMLYSKEANNFFLNVFKETVKFRETNKIFRKDALELLMELKDDPKRVNKEEDAAIQELAAHAFAIYMAGFESSASAITFCLYELTANPDIQTKLREEIAQVLAQHDDKLTYEAVMDMKYLDQVVDETLRLYPPVSFTDRQCMKDYKIPGTKVVIEKGIQVLVPIFALHRDPDYHPNPDKFDPERFSPENKHKIVPFSYLPFGEGHRICLGLRVGINIIKIAVALLLRDYTISLDERTKTPIEFQYSSAVLASKSTILLNLNKIHS